jgi:hypothetical protein
MWNKTLESWLAKGRLTLLERVRVQAAGAAHVSFTTQLAVENECRGETRPITGGDHCGEGRKFAQSWKGQANGKSF